MTSAPTSQWSRHWRANLPGWDVEPREAQSRLPCGPDEQCVVIADGSMDASIPGDLAQAAVADHGCAWRRSECGGALGVRVAADIRVPPAWRESSSPAVAVDAAREIGSASPRRRGASSVAATHEWSARRRSTIDVPWWPIDTGARALRIEACSVRRRANRVDNHVDVGVDVGATRSPVLVFDARPSWSSTFVRRAIEDDRAVRGRLPRATGAGAVRRHRERTPRRRGARPGIDGRDRRCLDALTSSDVALLEQFVRVRGGTLVLLPERAPAGPWSAPALRDMDRAPDGEARNGGRAARQRSPARRAAAYHRDRARTLGIVSVDRRLAGWRRTHRRLRRDGCVALLDDLDCQGGVRPILAIADCRGRGFGRRPATDVRGAAVGAGLACTIHAARPADGAAASTEASAVARCGCRAGDA